MVLFHFLPFYDEHFDFSAKNEERNGMMFQVKKFLSYTSNFPCFSSKCFLGREMMPRDAASVFPYFLVFIHRRCKMRGEEERKKEERERREREGQNEREELISECISASSSITNLLT